MKQKLLKITYSAFFMALCLVLPLLTGQNMQLGQAILPMHIPVFLCAFICGPVYAAAVGFISPIFRSLIFGMPPMFPVALAMAFELAVYGAVSGLFYYFIFKKFKNDEKNYIQLIFMYISLIIAMFCGRAVGGFVTFLCVGMGFKEFLTAYFVTGFIGIILQLIVIPPLVYTCNDIIKHKQKGTS